MSDVMESFEQSIWTVFCTALGAEYREQRATVVTMAWYQFR